MRRLLGAFRRTARLHLTPGLLPPPGRLLGRSTGDITQPHEREPSSAAGSIGRIGYLAADTALGWLPRVRIPAARSTLVVFERGWSDLRVDPRRYRLSGGEKMVRVLDRVLPSPDLRMLITADPNVVHARKPGSSPPRRLRDS